jgi:crotonobetainyl-CoA:carnitine CoA-transferase CaiB-like acyl-CoA transferase
MVDVVTGLNAAVAILAALRRRDETGEGEHVHVSLLDSALSALVNVAESVLVTGEEAGRHGNAHPNIAPYQLLEAADGPIAVAAANDGLFTKLCQALGRSDLLDDPRFATNADRVRNRAELVTLLEQTLAARPAADWIDMLTAAGVPVGKVRGVLDALEAAGGSTLTVDHPTIGSLRLVRTAPRFASAGTVEPMPPPLLGEHTREVLDDA